jgi:putative membrane-bound dehydrogenase-like protein
MRRLALAAGLLTAFVSSAAPAGGGPGPATHQVRLNGHVFTLPEGFDVELAAGPPLVERPIVADFDEQGRLYVADSSGSNEKVDVQLQKRPHRILRLEAADGGGRFGRRAVFADRMMFPEGVLWFAGSLYVAAPPSIWKLTDADGGGVAGRRVEWFQGKTLTGCANDLHGPYLGPDGWIYWCKGAFAKQTYERPGRAPFVTRAAHIFRCRPDGTGLEPVMTGGMDNPVEVAFTPGGERIFTTTFLQHPGGGLRDGLIHAVYGGVYGKEHDVLDGHPRTAPGVMPVLTHLGPAAPAGLCRYESAAFGPGYRDNLFAALFNLRKVTRHVLEPRGATFVTRDEDFLVSVSPDFHPTDVLEDADGSLLVVDTGGWYKLCCPTSQLHKPDVLGAIYRVRRTGAPQPDDPRGLKLPWTTMTADQLAGLLDDPRPAVRRRAVQALADKGADAVPSLESVLRKSGSAEARRNAVWSATRIDRPEARAAVRAVLAVGDETARQAALHSASAWRDREAVPQLVALLKGPSLHNRRAAAEALGRIGDRSAVPALLAAAGEPADRVLEHSLTYALIEIADPGATAAGLRSGNTRTRRAALVALDQMGGNHLKPDAAAELWSDDPALREAAVWVAAHHPEWGTVVAGYFRQRLAVKGLPPAEREELTRQLAGLARDPVVPEMLTLCLGDPAVPAESRRVVLRAMAQAGLKEAPDGWADAVARVLTGDDRDLIPEAVAAARALRFTKPRAAQVGTALLKAAGDARLAAATRVAALAAVPGGLAAVDDRVFSLLRDCLGPEEPVASRAAAAEVLSHARLTREQLLSLAEVVKTAGPLEVDRLLDAFAQSSDDRVGQALVAALKASPARAGLRVDTLKPRLAKFGPAVQKEAEGLYAALDADAAGHREQLERLLAKVGGGDPRRGQAVFNGPKAACSSCHAIGYLGGKVGPDLTTIGKIRTERDLLESIVFPSASFVRSYEPMLVRTKAGKTVNGVVRKDAPDEVVLAVSATEEVQIPRDEIEDMQPGKVSIMPAGLDQQLTPQELADLVAFLKACK